MAKVLIGVGQEDGDAGKAAHGLARQNLSLCMTLYCKAELIRHGIEVRIMREQDGGNCPQEKIRICNAYAPDAALILRIRAGERDGFEVCHTRYGGVGKTLAKNIEEEIKKIGQNSRGLKIRVNEEGRDDSAFIRCTKCPVVILDAGCTDLQEQERGDSLTEERKFGMACAKGILRTLGIAWRPDNGSTVKNSMDVILEKTGLDQYDVDYLLAYPDAKDLVIKLAAAMQ